MRGSILVGVVGSCLFMASGLSSLGDLVVIDRVDQHQPSGSIYGGLPGYTDSADGGEFTIIPADTSLLANYNSLALVQDPNLSNQVGLESFCLELNVGYPTNLPVGPINSQVLPGILNNPGEQITLGTAWLYSQFASGTLTGYNYLGAAAAFGPVGWTSLRGQDAAALQAAIWYLEGQYPNDLGQAFADAGGSSNKFLDLLTTDTADGGLGLTSLADAEAIDPGGYGVNVLNIGTPGELQYQAQLVLDPGVVPLIPVPECGAAWMPFGLVCFAGFRLWRKRRLSIA